MSQGTAGGKIRRMASTLTHWPGEHSQVASGGADLQLQRTRNGMHTLKGKHVVSVKVVQWPESSPASPNNHSDSFFYLAGLRISELIRTVLSQFSRAPAPETGPWNSLEVHVLMVQDQHPHHWGGMA